MESEKPRPPIVVKVGGSLFDLPNLGPRLLHWLAKLSTREVVLVPGGGPVADLVRVYDRLHALGDERAHWLALFALAFSARFLASLLPGAVIVKQWENCAAHWLQGKLPIIDPYAFAHADEGRAGSLPHSWAATSDSLAARVAAVAGAGELILLKSVSLPEGIDWPEAGKRGFVDAYFAAAVGSSVPVRFINFRP